MSLRVVMIMSLAFVLTSLTQADTVTISKSTPFAENSGASDNVKKECGIELRFPKYLKDYAKKHTDVVFTTESLESAEGKVLYLEFKHVFALGGGHFSGTKSVSVVGELKENGEVIASLTADRAALFGIMPGTCSVLKRTVKKLGQDIGNWLKEPTMGAMLGNAASD